MTKLVDNELRKLVAGAFDRLSTGCVLAGVIHSIDFDIAE
jgi:hypothetical protein